jgi:hypothetical protein
MDDKPNCGPVPDCTLSVLQLDRNGRVLLCEEDRATLKTILAGIMLLLVREVQEDDPGTTPEAAEERVRTALKMAVGG